MRIGLLTLVVGVVLAGSVVPTAAAAGAGGTNALAPGAGAVGTADAADGMANATAVESGEEVTGRVTPADRANWYAVEADAGDLLRVVGSDGMGEVRFSLVGPDGEELDAGEATANRAAIGAVADTDGTHYVRASTPADGLGGAYDFTVAVGTDDATEPDDDAGSAPAVDDGDRVEATLAEGDEDWYAVEADAGDLLTAAAVRTDGGGTDVGQGFRLDVVAPDGERVGLVDDADDAFNRRTSGVDVGDDSADTAFQRAVADTDGTYYVRVVPVADDGGTVEGFVDYELVAHARTPTPLAANESVDASFAASTDAHGAYTFDANASETLRVTAESAESGVVVSVLAPDGSSVARASVSGTATFDTSLGTDGPAYVVTRPSAGALGARTGYTLSVDAPDRPSEDEETTPDDGGNATATPTGDADGTATPTGDGTATPDNDANGTATPSDGDETTPDDGNGTATPTDDGDATATPDGDDGTATPTGGANGTDDGNATATPAAGGDGAAAGGSSGSDDDDGGDSDDSDASYTKRPDDAGTATATPTATATATATATRTPTATATATPDADERAGGAAAQQGSVAADGLRGATGASGNGLGPLLAVVTLVVGSVALMVRR
ncbi:hypothetical protein [Candidatus Halobonum tyrrellensis]|uniref:Pre-peptidase n=1 Tax=Candidatus Halobonum tyrrellensis G22 TaxID=1324957 RepID=V4HP08_9EURY|nr:hypothetical protein [Candidatus Halobonum tyrrellensis]ESP89654.1 pre-peptidase [Candidatus Halobonum tyrrellensis G22]